MRPESGTSLLFGDAPQVASPQFAIDVGNAWLANHPSDTVLDVNIQDVFETYVFSDGAPIALVTWRSTMGFDYVKYLSLYNWAASHHQITPAKEQQWLYAPQTPRAATYLTTTRYADGTTWGPVEVSDFAIPMYDAQVELLLNKTFPGQFAGWQFLV